MDDRRTTAACLTLMALIAAASLSACARRGPPDVGKERAAEIAVELYAMLADVGVTVLEVSSHTGYYQVDLVANRKGALPQRTYVSRDGKLIFDNVIEVAHRREKLTRNKEFVACLIKKGVRLYADPRSGDTEMQLALIGPFGERLVVNCALGNRDMCRKHGVTELPSLGMDGEVHAGLKSKEWLEAFSGCK